MSEHSITVAGGESVRLKTAGKYCDRDIIVNAIGGGDAGGGSSEEWIGDGNTHIWITLPEGRTSPMLGVCPKGTVTVDWGDNTEPDILVGESVTTQVLTPTHEYTAPGDYIITLTINGQMGFKGDSSAQGALCLMHSAESDVRNVVYRNAIKKIEMGNDIAPMANNAFSNCYNLTRASFSSDLTSTGSYTFNNCYNLTSVNIPNSVASIGMYGFFNCYSLTNINIPNSVTSIKDKAFYQCDSLTNINIPSSVTSIGEGAFEGCHGLTSVNIPEKITSIAASLFSQCDNLTNISIPNSVISIGSAAFSKCYGLKFCDFSNHTIVPTMSKANAFNSIPPDCEIRVPAALYDEWIAATNWSTYASQIVAV